MASGDYQGISCKPQECKHMPVSKIVKLSGFILIIAGTLGLLINEVVFDWGRAATLTFAVINVAGLAGLAFAHWGARN